MKLFLIEGNDNFNVGYDQFDGFVIRASDQNKAWELAKNLVLSASFTEQSAEYFNKNNFIIKELENDGKEDIIITSYNAG